MDRVISNLSGHTDKGERKDLASVHVSVWRKPKCRAPAPINVIGGPVCKCLAAECPDVARTVYEIMSRVGPQPARVVAAFIGTAFVQEDADAARMQWRQVADQLRPKVPKLMPPWAAKIVA